jgi:uncharacterized membrane protein YphA (DoxX/SURF4 family)
MSDSDRRPAAWAGGRGRGLAGGRFRSPLGVAEEKRARAPETAPVPAGTPAAGTPATGIRGAAARAEAVTAQWAPTAARILLGLVLAWFGYHELLTPGEWTGYVPVLNETSNLSIIAVLVHGWILLVLAAALIAGIAPRVSAAISAVLLLEIVISLAVSGLSDTTLRDAGVLGLAVSLVGSRNQRLVLRN